MNFAHIHLILNHIPVLGAGLGCVVLCAASIRKERSWLKAAFAIFVAAAVVALIVYFTGEPAEKVVSHLPGVTEAAIEKHEEAALICVIALEITGVLSLIGLHLLRQSREIPRWLTGLLFISAAAAFGLSGWTANLGGQIRHEELRSGFNVERK